MAMILIDKKEITEDGVVYIVETYKSDKTGKYSVVKYPKPSDVAEEPVMPEPTQLDRIEGMLSKSQEEIKNEAIDEYTSMLMEEGVI